MSLSLKRSIAELVPHAGAMVLLHEVIAHDDQTIHCRADTGPINDHPLRRGQTLPATALAEYGAQAIAVHGGLMSEPGQPPRPGRLVALGQFDTHVDQLTDTGRLDVWATRLSGDEAGQIYEFRVARDNQALASGRATIMFADRAGQA